MAAPCERLASNESRSHELNFCALTTMGSGVGRSCGNERRMGVIVIPCTMIPSLVVAGMDTKRWPSKLSTYRIEERLLRRTCVVGPAVAPGPGTIRYDVDELQLQTGDAPRV
jgi:hypothetical protein